MSRPNFHYVMTSADAQREAAARSALAVLHHSDLPAMIDAIRANAEIVATMAAASYGFTLSAIYTQSFADDCPSRDDPADGAWRIQAEARQKRALPIKWHKFPIPFDGKSQVINVQVTTPIPTRAGEIGQIEIADVELDAEFRREIIALPDFPTLLQAQIENDAIPTETVDVEWLGRNLKVIFREVGEDITLVSATRHEGICWANLSDAEVLDLQKDDGFILALLDAWEGEQ